MLLAQQPNHPNATQFNFTLTSSLIGLPQWIPGPFYLEVSAGSGFLVTQTNGLQAQYFETWASFGPPQINSAILSSGTVDLNLNTLFVNNPVFSGVTAYNGIGTYGGSAMSVPYIANQTFNFTTQSWVSDPTIPYGYRLTAAINTYR